MNEDSSEWLRQPQYRVPLDAESVELRAWAVVKEVDMQIGAENDSIFAQVQAAADHVSHRYNRNFRQLGKAVDEATGLTNDATKRHRDALLVGLVGVGSAFGATMGAYMLKNIMYKKYYF